MKFAVYFDASGEAVSFSMLRDTDEPHHIPGMTSLVVGHEPELPGYVAGGVYVKRPAQPSLDHVWDVTSKTWAFDAAMKEARLVAMSFNALAEVDQAAGTARLRYITSVPGQAETYQRKEQQAREWKAAGFTGTPPVFVAAEAQALGQDPVDVANYIIDTADQWGNFNGPQIEATRRKWKVAIDLAGTDEAAIVAARDAGIAELMAL